MGISQEQALDCFNSDDLIGIGMEADAVRRRLHPEGVVSYVLDRTLCYPVAGFEAPGFDLFDLQLAEAEALGASGLTLRCALEPEMSIDAMTAMLAGIRGRFPSLWLHGLSATEVVAIATRSGSTIRETLERLQEAGLQSLSGSDAGVLDYSAHAPSAVAAMTRCSIAEWIEVHRTAHRIALPTMAAMRFGAGETMDQRMNHLEAVRQLQEETGGFIAFVLATFQPAATGSRNFEEPTAVEYLNTLAISRMVLDTIVNVQADWGMQGLKVLQMALRFGANDVGSTMPGKCIVPADGTTEEDLRRVIRGAGFRPVERDTVYRTMFLD